MAYSVRTFAPPCDGAVAQGSKRCPGLRLGFTQRRLAGNVPRLRPVRCTLSLGGRDAIGRSLPGGGWRGRLGCVVEAFQRGTSGCRHRLCPEPCWNGTGRFTDPKIQRCESFRMMGRVALCVAWLGCLAAQNSSFRVQTQVVQQNVTVDVCTASIGGMIQPLVTGPRGEAAVVAFDSRIKWLRDFTTDDGKVRSAVENLKPSSARQARTLRKPRPGQRNCVSAGHRNGGASGYPGLRGALFRVCHGPACETEGPARSTCSTTRFGRPRGSANPAFHC